MADVEKIEEMFASGKNVEVKWKDVVKLVGGFYLRQYIDGKQQGRGLRITKEFIKSIGILDFQEVTGSVMMNG